MRHSIIIDDKTYTNVGSIDTSTEPVFYHNVVTLDGKTHQQLRYYKTSHKVVFFNLLNDEYEELRHLIQMKQIQNQSITCGFPDDADGFVYADYYLTIVAEKNKGYLRGRYFRNGLEVEFEKVNADEI